MVAIDLEAETPDRVYELAYHFDAAGDSRAALGYALAAAEQFLAEDFVPCSWYGDRSLNRYRAIAQKQLGAACSTGLFLPDQSELPLTLQDWLDEFERIQLMLRLSTRLRQKHND